MPKGIKKTTKIIILIVAIPLIVLAALPILLQNSKIQNYIAQMITKSLSEMLQTTVTVGDVDYDFFNQIKVSNVYVEDRQKDTLIFVGSASAGFNFRQLFKGKLLFDKVGLDRPVFHLKADTLGATNLDFVIEAFKKDNSNDSSTVEYRVRELKIKNATFSYSKQHGRPTKAANIFNADSILLRNLDATILLNVLKSDSLNVEIPSLSFTERSGFRVDKMSTQLAASKTSAKLNYVKLLMPDSEIYFDQTTVNYKSLAAFSDFIHEVRWQLPLKQASVALSDIVYFAPELSKLKEHFVLSGLISGRVSSLKFQDFSLNYGKNFTVNANLELSGLPNIEETFVYADINNLKVDKSDIQDVVSALTRKPFVLPAELSQLGTVNYTGNITGFFSNLVAYGNASTNIGSVSTDILLKFENNLRDLTYNGTVKSRNLQLGKMLPNSELGDVNFVLNTNGQKKANVPVRGNVKAVFNEIQFKEYAYKDIKLDGKYDGTGFIGNIDLKDENVSADFSGEIDLTKALPVFDFDIRVENANLYALNLISGYKDALLTFRGKTNMIGNSPDNINGFVNFDSIMFTNNDKTLNVNEINLTSRTSSDYSSFNVRSDFVNGSFSGNFKYSTVASTIKNIINYYLPALSGGADEKKYANHIDMDLQIENTGNFCEVFDLPYRISGVTILKGSIDEKMNKVDITANIPMFLAGKQKIENITLDIQSLRKELKMTSRANLHEKKGVSRVYLLAGASHDSVSTQVGWQNAQAVTNAGEFQTVTRFRKEDGKTLARMSILPTQIIVSDSVWDIRASKIDFKADSTFAVQNFRIDNGRQFVDINGLVSSKMSDSLVVKTNDLNLDYVMKLVRLKGIKIGGFVTGEIKLFSLLKQPVYLANLAVKNVSLNDMAISDARLFSNWDREKKRVVVGADFVKGNRDTVAVAYGYFKPSNDSIDIMFDVNSLSVSFLQRYFSGVAENVQGNGKGKLRMFGPMKKIGFEGDIFVDKAQVTIDMLKTTYYFSDTVRLTRNAIQLSDIRLYDIDRNQGTLKGLINHDGTFGNMKYNVNIQARNILAMNTTAADNEYFFGKAYATGAVNIFGDTKEANIQVNVVSRPGSKASIRMGGASTASDNDFITFVDPQRDKNVDIKADKIVEPKKDFNVKVDLQVEVTPDAQVELLVDPKAGDVISGRGNGNLRVQFDSFTDLKLFGTYDIDEGFYLFTLQTVIRKEFKIDRGSTISWSGDPFNAKVDIRAIYSLTASLSDLLDDVGSTTNRNVPVNCVLQLTDNLMKPNIKFDVDLPSSDEGVKQKVRGVINTEESMNRQIASLLFLNRFFTPSNVSDDNANSGWNQSLSLLTNTLSSQVNGWVQKSLNMNNLTLGFDVVTQTESDEYKALLNYQPNKRIVLNGNIGYRDENIASATNNSKFIGDIDFEYLLTESGKLRFKAYSHTVDRELLKEAYSMQGVGLAYKEDFQSVSHMLSYYWDALRRLFKSKKNEDNKNSN